MSSWTKTLRERLYVETVQNSLNGFRDKLLKKPTSQETHLLLGVEVIPNKKISYIIVEDAIDHFVGDYLPEKIDKLYSLVDDVMKLKNKQIEDFESSSLKSKLVETTCLVKDIYSTFYEVLELKKLMLKEADMEYFNLSVDPAKQKVQNVTEYFFECNTTIVRNKTPHARSPKARDLLSFMQTDNIQEESSNENDGCIGSVVFADHNYKQIPDEFLKHQELVDLYSSIVNLHELMIEEEDEQDDMISANIEDPIEVADNQERKFGQKVVRAIKVGALPAVGAVVGGVLAGPVGFMAGVKIASFTGYACAAVGTASAAVGSVAGYKGGVLINKKANIDVEDSDESKDQ